MASIISGCVRNYLVVINYVVNINLIRQVLLFYFYDALLTSVQGQQVKINPLGKLWLQ